MELQMKKSCEKSWRANKKKGQNLLMVEYIMNFGWKSEWKDEWAIE